LNIDTVPKLAAVTGNIPEEIAVRSGGDVGIRDNRFAGPLYVLASRRRHQQKKQCWEMELRSIQKNSDHRNNTGRQSFESAVHAVESHCGDV